MEPPVIPTLPAPSPVGREGGRGRGRERGREGEGEKERGRKRVRERERSNSSSTLHVVIKSKIHSVSYCARTNVCGKKNKKVKTMDTNLLTVY